jgi:hypothetical protein
MVNVVHIEFIKEKCHNHSSGVEKQRAVQLETKLQKILMIFIHKGKDKSILD